MEEKRQPLDLDLAPRGYLEEAREAASDFLGLSEEESAIIDMKISLSKKFVTLRRTSNLTQVKAAKVLHTSQSRIAKMESGDPSVSIDLLIKGMVGLGASKRTVGQTLVKA